MNVSNNNPIQLHNSLTRQKEVFEPISGTQEVGMYTCGPTVYDYPTIGNWRTYTLSDLTTRTLKLIGYNVTHVMNLTDVGHLTGDNDGDSSSGEDRLEKASKREGKSAWNVADFYGKDFLQSLTLLNIQVPDVVAKATDNIKEQIDLVKQIEKRGYTYKTSDGIYFDVAKYEKDGNKYGELSTLDEIREGARVEINPERKDPRDFALWKFSPKDEKRDMEWESPWGLGFPGWHIECSAMGMKYLGETFDLHLGGEDLRSTHHPNEIAQSEAGTGQKPFVKYWIHGAFILINGGRMGKSLGNAYTIHDVIKKGFHPLALRYFYLTGHYRKQINFSWDALESAQNSLQQLWRIGQKAKSESGKNPPSQEAIEIWKEFLAAITDDLNMPQALATLRSGLDRVKNNPSDILFLMDNADLIFGLDLMNPHEGFGKSTMDTKDLPSAIQKLINERNTARKSKDWQKADEIRDELESQGYTLVDENGETKILK